MQNTSTTNKQTTVPYDVSLRPNTTYAYPACPHCVLRALFAKHSALGMRGGHAWCAGS